MKKIISYNVNGIRAAIKKGLLDWVLQADPDVLCIQETKAQAEQIDVAAFEAIGYYAYTFSAQKKGYSGVAIFTKQKPDFVKYGMDNELYDFEGRVLQVDFGDVSVITTYFPSGSYGEVRQDFKMKFLYDYKQYIDELRKTRKKLIVAGDYNVCHKPIDINHPERHKKSSGFLPEEREWFDKFIESGFVDTFREFDTSPEKYSWWSYRAASRSKNLGWRIDYHLISESLKPNLSNAYILPNAMHSDHCPVVVELDV